MDDILKMNISLDRLSENGGRKKSLTIGNAESVRDYGICRHTDNRINAKRDSGIITESFFRIYPN